MNIFQFENSDDEEEVTEANLSNIDCQHNYFSSMPSTSSSTGMFYGVVECFYKFLYVQFIYYI